MKSFSIINLLALMALGLSGCAGDEADYEEAEYLLAKGGVENGATVASMMAAKCNATTAVYNFEACRLYSGGKMQAAGFDGIAIISKFAYNSGTEPIALLRSALTFNSNTITYLGEAETALESFEASTAFTGSTDTRAKNGIQFQHGLVKFFQALRATLDITDLETGSATLTQADCETKLLANASTVTQSRSDLTDSKTALNDSGLDNTNDLVTMVTEFRDQIPSATITTTAEATAVCQYIVGQTD